MKKFSFISFVAVAFLIVGCSNFTAIRIKELQAVEARIDTLAQRLVDVQNEILDNQKKQAELLRLLRADQLSKFTALEGDVSKLVNAFAENEQRLSKIDKKTAEIRKHWEEASRGDSLRQVQSSSEMENYFKVAYNDFVAGRYELALNGFEQFFAQYPDSELAEEAAFWTAESNYALTNYEEAQKQYMGYIKAYPQGKKICPALYKLGLVFRKLNKEKSTNMVWDKLSAQCPESQEAQLAAAQR